MNKQIICISVNLERALFMKHFFEFVSTYDVMIFVINFLINGKNTSNKELTISKIIEKIFCKFYSLVYIEKNVRYKKIIRTKNIREKQYKWISLDYSDETYEYNLYTEIYDLIKNKISGFRIFFSGFHCEKINDYDSNFRGFFNDYFILYCCFWSIKNASELNLKIGNDNFYKLKYFIKKYLQIVNCEFPQFGEIIINRKIISEKMNGVFSNSSEHGYMENMENDTFNELYEYIFMEKNKEFYQGGFNLQVQHPQS